MASEISVAVSLGYANTPKSVPSVSLSLSASFNITGQFYVQETKSYASGGNGVAIPMGAVATPGWMYVKNLDATNFISVLSAVSGTSFCKLKAGEAAVFRIDPALTAPAIRADTAACICQTMILDD